VNYSIVIPVLNEEKNLSKLLPEIYNRLKKINFELIIIDDNSTDNTSTIINNFKKKNLKYFIRKNDKDLSRACIFGFNKSINKNIIVMDGDYQHKPRDLLKLINFYEKNNIDLIVGTRKLFKKKNKGLGIIRLNVSRILILIVNILLGEKTSDPMSGFFIFKKKIYKRAKNELLKDGYKILLDLIYNSKNLDISIKDMSISFDSRKNGKSKMSLKIIFKLLRMIFLKFYLIKIK